MDKQAKWDCACVFMMMTATGPPTYPCAGAPATARSSTAMTTTSIAARDDQRGIWGSAARRCAASGHRVGAVAFQVRPRVNAVIRPGSRFRVLGRRCWVKCVGEAGAKKLSGA